MSFDGEEKHWSCGRTGVARLRQVSSIVRDIGEPCLHQSPVKITKMLKPDKWQAAFDSDGKVFGFRQALKLIVLGGVDPSIRPEVWEFLLGCYALGSTAEYRRRLRMARRKRYKDLIQQCQMMHSSIGTGSLAYVAGSKVMDVRTLSRDHWMNEAEVNIGQTSDPNSNQLETYSEWGGADMLDGFQRVNSSDFTDLVGIRRSTDNLTCDSSPVPNSDPSRRSFEPAVNENYFDFPSLPVTNLFEKFGQEEGAFDEVGDGCSTKNNQSSEVERMHSFQINNNVHLVMESDIPEYNNTLFPHGHSEIEMVYPADHKPILQYNKVLYRSEKERLVTHDLNDTHIMNSTSEAGAVGGDRVSEWLWTLHQISVDVVRTDNHLEFYEDTKNLARMSDILSVYAWIDPATGYCQGMSDLLSPFIVLYDDNADAFWCFEMLLRRMRQNFQMEGPTRVMKQLHALWHILELTDRDIFAHLSHIGAESLHFAFRMLLVLFRRELSFSEALCMWEMMWAADFDESAASSLEENCLEPLLVQVPTDLDEERVEIREGGGDDYLNNGMRNDDVHSGVKPILQLKQKNAEQSLAEIGMRSASTPPLCGLTKNFWSRNDHLQICKVLSPTGKEDDELPVFCVAAILIVNRHKLMREAHSIDDLIKIFNDKLLKINVKRCVHLAIKLRKRYYYKVIKSKNLDACNDD